MKKILMLIAAAAMAMAATQASAAEAYTAGTHYTKIVPVQVPQDIPQGKVEVTEFFWYGCPHCYDFEPHVEKWLQSKPDNIVFKRVPAIFNKGWVIHAKAYYAAEMLDITDKVHSVIFEKIHKGKQGLGKAEEVAALMAEASGLGQQVILDTINSFAIESKSRQAIQEARLHRLRGVPAMAVNGKYLTSARQAGGYPEMLKVVDALVKQELAK